MRHMHSGVALLTLGALASLGAAYDAVWADQHVATYRVVAHDPACVALYVEAIDGATTLTTLQESYTSVDIIAGIPMLIQVPEDRAATAAESLLERSPVHSVQRIGTYWNGTHIVQWPVEINPDAVAKGSHCYDIDFDLKQILRDTVIGTAGGASGKSHEEMAHVRLNPNNLTSMRAYLEENGATIQSAAASREYEGRMLGPQIIALIPYSIIPSLVERDDFGSMNTIHPPELLENGGTSDGFGTTHTWGLSLHERWSDPLSWVPIFVLISIFEDG